MTVLFHGDGDSKKGLGHLVRSLSLALEMPKDIKTVFATTNVPLAKKILSQLSSYFSRSIEIYGIPVNDPDWRSSASPVGRALVQLTQDLHANIIVSDGKYPWGPQEMERFLQVASLVLVDNLNADLSHADLLVLPTDHASDEIQTSIPAGRLRTGLSWTWIHPAARRKTSVTKDIDITVSLGGADPSQLTLKALDRIEESAQFSKKAVVIGASFAHAKKIHERLANSPSWSIIEGAHSSHEVFARSHLVLCAFGITPYECYAMGVPTWIVTHDLNAISEVDLFLNRHPDVGERINLAVELPKVTPHSPRPAAEIGQLAKNLANELEKLTSR